MNILVCGGRDFTNIKLLRKYCSSIISENDTVLCGMAPNGADLFAYRWCKQYNVNILEFPADWKKYGKGAGMVRNNLMLKQAHYILAFWDGKSPGTGHNVEQAKKLKIPITIVYY